MRYSTGDKLGPYEILAPLGSGGMGEVYRARDPRLNRDVAIKASAKEFSSRFEHEARAVAALNHPHICQIYDLGADYLVLEYIEGKPVNGPMRADQAVNLALQIADALEEAHSKGILHRDLKPANILLTAKGAIKLLDFGLAKLMTPSGTDATLTVEGAIVGTVAYMAPEQAEGKPLDERSDIFSFGAVLYEMLSGNRAFGGNSIAQVLIALLRDEPAPIKAPAGLQHILSRCMSKIPGERFATMAEIRTALEQLRGDIVGQQKPSIAVLPFANMSRDLDDEYFSDGLAEEIISALTHIEGLRVIARTSAFAFKNKNEDIRGIAEALGVSNVLEGSVRRSGNRLRITAQLINASDGTHLWSQRYDREVADVFAIQDEISVAIAKHLKVHFVSGTRSTTNVVAYEAFLKGRHHWAFLSPPEVQKAFEYFQEAIDLDPGYAPAHCGVAEYYISLLLLGIAKPAEIIPKIQSAAARALKLDATLADAHSILAQVFALLYQWDQSKDHFARAMELRTTVDYTVQPFILWYLEPQSLLDRALEVVETGLAQDPLSFFLCLTKSRILAGLGRTAEAVDWSRRAVEINSGYIFAAVGFADALARNGQFDQAIATAEQMIQLAGRWPWTLFILGSVHARAGHSNDTLEILDELHRYAQTNPVPPGLLATLHAQHGGWDAAFEWADKAVAQYDPALLILIQSWKSFLTFDYVHVERRYGALLGKMGLNRRP